MAQRGHSPHPPAGEQGAGGAEEDSAETHGPAGDVSPARAVSAGGAPPEAVDHDSGADEGQGAALDAGSAQTARREVPAEFAAATRRLLLMTAFPRAEGWLFKRGGVSLGLEALKAWKRRWFMLDHVHLLYWSDREACASGAPPRGAIPLQEARCERATADGVPSEFVLALSWPRGAWPRLLLVASREEDMRMWEAAFDAVRCTLDGDLQGRGPGAILGRLEAWEQAGIGAYSSPELRDRGWATEPAGTGMDSAFPPLRVVPPLVEGSTGGASSPVGEAPSSAQDPLATPMPPLHEGGGGGDAATPKAGAEVGEEVEDWDLEGDAASARCPACGEDNVADALFCDQCGARIEW